MSGPKNEKKGGSSLLGLGIALLLILNIDQRLK